MIKFNWMFWHRWLGLLTCLGIFLWGVSGISHPIMTRLQPTPVSFSAPAAKFDLTKAVPLSQVLVQYHVKQISHVSLAQLSDKSYYRVSSDIDQPARYFDTVSGKELMNGDAIYAKLLASHFTGINQQHISKVVLVTNFSDDYHAVNRLLPVWRVEFLQQQHLRAYIDTEQSRLAALVNDTRYWLTKLFEFGHNWSFLQFNSKLQLIIPAVVLCAVIASAISGLYLYFKLGNQQKRLNNQPVKRLHRRLGLLISIVAIIFASSGFFHLIMSDQQQKNALIMKPEFVLTEKIDAQVWQQVTKSPFAKLDLIVHAGIPYWYVLEASLNGENQMPVAQVAALAKESEHHAQHQATHADMKAPFIFRADANVQNSNNVMAANNIEDLAKMQVVVLSNYSMTDIVSTEWITKFAKEYGFIFKRLPVIKVQLNNPEHTRYYIEPATGAVSVKVRDIDGLEGFVFAYLHKWAFESFNKDCRDFIVALFALLNIILGLLGINLFLKYRAKLAK